MARYVDMSAYEGCRIVANAEDVGFAVKELPTAGDMKYRMEKMKNEKDFNFNNGTFDYYGNGG